jgi:glycosyltransferase involved in cell wall biosynthesis
MKIALVTPSFLPDIGGLEVHVGHLARRLAAMGHSVEVLTQASVPMACSEKSDGATVRRFPIRMGGRAYPFAPSLWRYILQNSRGYDVVHMHSYHGTAAIPAALANVRRLVFTPHYLGSGRTALARAVHRPYHTVGTLLFKRADHIVCTTDAEVAMLKRDFPGAARKTTVIANGIDVEVIQRAAPIDYGKPLVLCAGRLETYKNVHMAVKALPYLEETIKLAIVGEGPASEPLAHLADQLGVASRVNLVGGVPWPGVYGWMRAADVFVTMSARESFGMSVLEAHVAGAHVVASDIPPHRELSAAVGPRVALVPLTAPPAELAAAISAAVAASAISAAAASSAPEAVHDVPTWDDHVDSLLSLYA